MWGSCWLREGKEREVLGKERTIWTSEGVTRRNLGHDVRMDEGQREKNVAFLGGLLRQCFELQMTNMSETDPSNCHLNTTEVMSISELTRTGDTGPEIEI